MAPRVTRNDLAMSAVVLLWGANFTAIRVALDEIPPLTFTAIRFTLASVALWGLLRLREGSAGFPPGTGWRMVWLGVVGNTAYQTLFVAGLARTTVANASLLLATSPVMVALGAGLLRVERVSRQVAAGIALAFAGASVILLGRGAAIGRETILGDLLVWGAAACWAAYTLGLRKLGRDVSPLRVTTLTTITGTPGLVLAALPEWDGVAWAGIGAAGWLGLGYSTVLALILAYFLWNESVRQVGGSRTAVYVCAVPLVAMLIAWPTLGEAPTGLALLGASLIVGGLLLARRT
ncbi:MAG TPA: EamA family transporter [Gemmatimonadales bacterium]|nr:EamA family transporter [Gemmatimonadales bacterium]